jgi:hypothetical protein
MRRQSCRRSRREQPGPSRPAGGVANQASVRHRATGRKRLSRMPRHRRPHGIHIAVGCDGCPCVMARSGPMGIRSRRLAEPGRLLAVMAGQIPTGAVMSGAVFGEGQAVGARTAPAWPLDSRLRQIACRLEPMPGCGLADGPWWRLTWVTPTVHHRHDRHLRSSAFICGCITQRSQPGGGRRRGTIVQTMPLATGSQARPWHGRCVLRHECNHR